MEPMWLISILILWFFNVRKEDNLDKIQGWLTIIAMIMLMKSI